MSDLTTVHLLRHGEVHNPEGVLYGRLPHFRLSERGEAMAERVADRIGDRDITTIVASPLLRAQQTAAPLADRLGLPIKTDVRLLESTNKFEGTSFKDGYLKLLEPRYLRYLWNPLRPSWGEPYKSVATRMWSAVLDAKETARGHEAVLVSHQLPIWICRLHAERRSFVHNPRNRQCTLCSLSSFTFSGDELVSVGYSEPAGDLIPRADRKDNFSAGGSEEQTS